MLQKAIIFKELTFTHTVVFMTCGGMPLSIKQKSHPKIPD